MDKIKSGSSSPKVANQFYVSIVTGVVITIALMAGAQPESAAQLALWFAPAIVGGLAGLAAGYITTDKDKEQLSQILSLIRDNVDKEHSMDTYLDLIAVAFGNKDEN